MSSRSAVALAIVGLMLLAAAYMLGGQQQQLRYDRALRSAQHQSDSLRIALERNVALVLIDTIRVDSIVERWHKRRVDTLPGRVDTLPGRVDTVPLLTLANETIEHLDTARRRCVAVLNDCAATAAALTTRATLAEARVGTLEAASQMRSRWRTAERAICATSIATNFIQWRAYR